MDEPAKATEKAKQLIAMTVAKTRFLQPIQEAEIPVLQKALVIGGGIAGITVALSLADQGYETTLVEKEHQLGGYLHKVYYTVDGLDIPRLLKEMTEKIQKHPLIKVHTGSQVKSLKGYVGSYESEIQTPTEVVPFSHGVIIVTVGADEYKPHTYHYSKDPRVLTQSELEKNLSESKKEYIHDGETFVMIQCVESRDEKRPYCSRICCMQAVKNALKIKELNPRAEVFLLYRDLMTYGFKEKFYKDAREKGVMFLQYDPEKKPEVEAKNGLVVKIHEPMLGELLKIPTDHLILSTGLQPNPDNSVIGKLLKVPVNDDGFFLEAHVKLRPVDFSTRGVFVAGNCHVPKFLSESIYQAQAAAARAATILSKPTLKAEPNVAFVDDDLCSGCSICISVCPYNAIERAEEEINGKKVIYVKINEGLCQGCGTCVSACPSSAIQQRGFKDKQLLPMIDEISC
jgi:heterodisulfide reductase subunit A